MTAVPLPDEARRFLEDVRIGILATINRDGTPQQSAIWYEIRGDEILMNTKRGRLKDRNLRRDPRCSLCVEERGDRYITIRGTVRLIEDREVAQADIRRLATRYDGAESAERQMRDQFSKEERVTVWMSIDRVKLYGFDSSSQE
jgi:PPOX class probable F420-dependent enzyme